jgi:hypothetical protein
VSKALLGDYLVAKKKKKPMETLGMEHMNGSKPALQTSSATSVLLSKDFQVSLSLCHFYQVEI